MKKEGKERKKGDEEEIEKKEKKRRKKRKRRRKRKRKRRKRKRKRKKKRKRKRKRKRRRVADLWSAYERPYEARRRRWRAPRNLSPPTGAPSSSFGSSTAGK